MIKYLGQKQHEFDSKLTEINIGRKLTPFVDQYGTYLIKMLLILFLS
jgi:hypothetical protein